MEFKELGQIVVTRAVSELEQKNENFRIFMINCFTRYLKSDWGDLSEDDWTMNDHAVASGDDRILASYPFPEDAPWDARNGYGGKENKLWIITEWDRSATTALFPGEY